MITQKFWFFSISPDPTRPDGVIRHMWPTWERAQAEALARGGIAEHEMIEVLKDDQTGGQVATGNRSYVYAGAAEEERTVHYGKDAPDYLAARKEALKRLGRSKA